MSISERIKELRQSLGLSQKEFGKKIGAGTSHVSQWERDISMPSGKALIGIAKLGANINWVLTGDGEMMKEPQVPLRSGKTFSEEQKLEIEKIVKRVLGKETS